MDHGDQDQDVLLPDGWTQHLAPSGHFFYYNKLTGQSSYDKPVAEPKPKPKPEPKAPKPPKRKRKVQTPDRPRLKVGLEGSWVLVVCKSGKRFVHNTETKQSAWDGPDWVMGLVEKRDKNEMIGLIAKARGLKLEQEKQPVAETETETEPMVEQPKSVPPVVDYQSSSSEEEEEEVEEESEFELVSDDEDEDMSVEEKRGEFFTMLGELGASAYGTWDNERDKFVEDDRYDLIDTNKQRRELFDEWATTKIHELKQQPRAVSRDPTEAFKQFVESVYKPKKHQFYLDFKRAVRKEPEFQQSKLTDKEKESVFRQVKKMA